MVTNSSSTNKTKEVTLNFDLIVHKDAVIDDARKIAGAVLLQLQTVTLPEEPDTDFMERWYAVWIAILYMQATRFPASKISVTYVITPHTIKHQTKGFGDGMDTPSAWTPQELEEAQSFVSNAERSEMNDDISNN